MTTKSSNKNLHTASRAKKDEFYTQLIDIEKELMHYKEQFKGKVVYCNCDDPYESNFFKFFACNFNALGLKKLMATSFLPSPIVATQLALPGMEAPEKQSPKSKSAAKGDKHAWKIEIRKVQDEDANGAFDLDDIAKQLTANKHNELTALKGNGDFRSDECIELLKQADIVVTNPPFSLFREYVVQLMENNKKFLILGNQNAITYKEIFKFIKENKLWLGYDNGGTKWFQVPDDYDIPTESRKKTVNGVKYFSMGSIVWYTNLDTAKRHEELNLYKKYSPEEFPKYDNYDAINVNRYLDIPCDYGDVMGVPVTFVDKYNPEQFEIIGHVGSVGADGVYSFANAIYLNSKKLFKRILIKNKKSKK